MSKDSVFPKDFEVKSSAGKYMKLKIGDNRFRILGEAITGNEYWVTTPDGKKSPVRKRKGDPITVGELEESGSDTLKQFVMFPVFNYQDNKVQILEITQKSVMKQLAGYEKDADWGDLKKYDVVVTRTGTDFNNTEYTVIAKPKKDITVEIGEEWINLLKSGFNLDEIYSNGDPFSPIVGSKEVNIDDIPF